MAVYDLELDAAARRSGIVSARGRIVMSLEGGPCAGWSTTTRMVVDYVFRRRGERLSDARNTSWESADGKVFRYSSANYSNGLLRRRIRLVAEHGEGADAPVVLKLTLPRKRRTELPAATLFPEAAARRVIAAALSGRGSFRYIGYEGFENGRPRLISVMIGKMRRQKPRKGPLAPLAGLRFWPVSIAYYPAPPEGAPARRDFGLPEYELSLRLFENGVADDVTLRFPDFSLRGRLKELRMHPPQACD